MTPKDKAEELMTTYRYILSYPGAPLGENKDEAAQRCSIATVNEIISAIDAFGYSGTWYDHEETRRMTLNEDESANQYWLSVKSELEFIKL
jgi:hypothetical protein